MRVKMMILLSVLALNSIGCGAINCSIQNAEFASKLDTLNLNDSPNHVIDVLGSPDFTERYTNSDGANIAYLYENQGCTSYRIYFSEDGRLMNKIPVRVVNR